MSKTTRPVNLTDNDAEGYKRRKYREPGESGRKGVCKSSCCKTPFGVCARQGACGCHVDVKSAGDELDRLLTEEP